MATLSRRNRFLRSMQGKHGDDALGHARKWVQNRPPRGTFATAPKHSGQYKQDETVNVAGFSHGWYQGRDEETGKFLIILAGHEDEGPVAVAPERVSPAPTQIERSS